MRYRVLEPPAALQRKKMRQTQHERSQREPDVSAHEPRHRGPNHRERPSGVGADDDGFAREEEGKERPPERNQSPLAPPLFLSSQLSHQALAYPEKQKKR